jgi:hypothetical protein
LKEIEEESGILCVTPNVRAKATAEADWLARAADHEQRRLRGQGRLP